MFKIFSALICMFTLSSAFAKEEGYLQCSGSQDYYLRVDTSDKKNVMIGLAIDANEVDSRLMSKLGWEMMKNEETPVELVFSAYRVSLKRIYTNGGSNLQGEIYFANGSDIVTCEPLK